MLGQYFEGSLQRTGAHPLLEAPVASLVWRKALGQILPARSRAQDPQHPVHHRTRFARRAPASALLGLWQQRLDQRPLLVGQLFPSGHGLHSIELDGITTLHS